MYERKLQRLLDAGVSAEGPSVTASQDVEEGYYEEDMDPNAGYCTASFNFYEAKVQNSCLKRILSVCVTMFESLN